MAVYASIITNGKPADAAIKAVTVQAGFCNVLKSSTYAFCDDATKNKFINIAGQRNLVRGRVLDGRWDWLWFVDDDVVPPEDALRKLLACNCEVVGGWYAMKGTPKFVCANRRIDGAWHNPYAVTRGISAVDAVGLGCCLIKRSVLERVQFSAGLGDIILCAREELGAPLAICMAGDCVSFGVACKEVGVQQFMCGDVICEHVEK